MSLNFAFPPPPPPPPKAASSGYPAYPQPAYQNFSGHNSGGTHIDGGSGFRGRGDRRRGFRGNEYGQRGHAKPSVGENRYHAGMSYGASSRGLGEYYGGQRITAPQQTNGPSGYPLPQYPQPLIPNFNGGPQPYNSTPTPHQSGYSNGYVPQTWAPLQPQLVPNPVQPSMMGPPIRMGFDREHPPDLRPTEHFLGTSANVHHPNNHQFSERSRHGRHISPNLRLPNNHVSPNPFPGNKHNNGVQQQRRKGFPLNDGSRPRDSRPRPNAAPSVPSFGGSLPTMTPSKVDDKKRPKKKKKRTHNVLGLTPRQEEHEESEEEDIDEEATLAGMIGSDQARLQVTYKGQTATLGTPSDIAAWIEERKKRFPTKQRVEQKKAELKRRLDIANESKKVAVKEKDRQRSQTVDAKQLAAEARCKMEKARRRLEKEQEKLARAEAAAADAEASKENATVKHTNGSKKRKRYSESSEEVVKEETVPALQVGDADSPQKMADIESTRHAKPSGTTSELADNVALASDDVSEDSMSISSTSSVLSNDEETSSSGSSSSDDERPEEAPSKRGFPVRVPPPERVKRNAICKTFAKTGRCKFRSRCRFSHDLQDSGGAKVGNGYNSKPKSVEDRAKPKRKGLYQKVSTPRLPYSYLSVPLALFILTVGFKFLESEKEKEDLVVIKAIKHLAENGVLGAGMDGPSSALESE
ncbi:MAG: hypothetical protein M1812_001529 [Candelaria pacifica]|nr:MAG: hypothetical protein M1812_001529 [Candelaria pacifica]